MKPAHKQRLVGGIVLLALGLIIVPTVLDFSGEERVIGKIEIPPEPEPMKTEVLDLTEWSKKVDPEVDQSEKIIEVSEPVSESIPKPVPESVLEKQGSETTQTKSGSKATEAPQASKQENKQPQTASSAKEAPAKTTKTAAPVEELEQPKPGVSGWVVQIGSFGSEDKAFALRDKLRKADFPAFVERAKRADGNVYRVKIGPVLNRNDAESMKQKAKRAVKLDGLIMQYR